MIDYDEIFNNICNVGSGNHLPTEYGGIYKEDGYFICQMPVEYAEFIQWCLEQELSFDLTMAIGIHAGGEVRLFRDYIKCKRTIVIDDGARPGFKHWKRNKKEIDTELFEFITDSHSLELRTKLSKFVDELEFVFIDGDHSETGCWQDLELSMSIAKDGCIIAIHDTHMCDGCQRVRERLHRPEQHKHFAKVFETNHKYGITAWRYHKC